MNSPCASVYSLLVKQTDSESAYWYVLKESNFLIVVTASLEWEKGSVIVTCLTVDIVLVGRSLNQSFDFY